ncbi:MAG TPA: YetF domain-containing protein, partial [Ruania sp.]|nr:YetF domain-containing protein [Ruania sp.]
LIVSEPVLLMAGSSVIEENMRHCHVVLSELQSRLRQAGVRHRGEVAAVVFEPSGAISVLRRGDGIDARLLEGVRGADQVPRELLR